MAIIWVLEKSVDPSERQGARSSIAQKLLGDYAVRAIASIRSLERICRSLPKHTRAHHLPVAIVADRCTFATEAFLIEKMCETLANACLIWVDDLTECGMKLSQVVAHTIHNSARELHVIRYKDVEFDTDTGMLTSQFGDMRTSLPPKELRILKMLLGSAGRPIDRRKIAASVWPDVKVSERTIDSHVSRLRKKLEGTEVSIESVYGGGYTLL